MKEVIPLKDRVPGRSLKALKALVKLGERSPQVVDQKPGMELWKHGLAYPVKNSEMFALTK